MRRFVLVSLVIVAGCAGPQVPTHNGYKTGEKAKPWKKPKTLTLDEKSEAKADGDLAYADYRRARWYALDIPATGELTLKLEVTPPGDSVNEDFDLAMEVLDPGFRVISKADAEEEDVGELNKARTLYDLPAGRYLIHLYLQGRMDTADFVLRATYKRAGAQEFKSDFPAQVAFVPALPMVPLNDDTPAKYKPPQTTVVTIKKGPKKGPDKPKDPPPSTAKQARIIGLAVTGGGTQITIGMGADQGAAAGWKAKIQGVQGTFPVAACNARTCTAIVAATPDQIKSGGGNVTLSP